MGETTRTRLFAGRIKTESKPTRSERPHPAEREDRPSVAAATIEEGTRRWQLVDQQVVWLGFSLDLRVFNGTYQISIGSRCGPHPQQRNIDLFRHRHDDGRAVL